MLNNRGWSLNAMIVLICVLLLTVILVSILVYNFGHGSGTMNPLFGDTSEVAD